APTPAGDMPAPVPAAARAIALAAIPGRDSATPMSARSAIAAPPRERQRLRPRTARRHAAERLVDGDHAREHGGFGLRNRVVRLELGALGVEQREEIHGPFAVADPGDRRGTRALACRLGEPDQSLLLLAIGRQRVLGLLDRAERGLLELCQRL